MDSIKLKEQREEILSTIEAIEALSVEEKRELTSEEKKQVSDNFSKVDSLNNDIKLAERMEKTKAERAKEIAPVVMTKGDKEEREMKEKYSFTKAVQTLARKENLTGRELEMHQEAEKENRAAGVSGGNLAVPRFIMEKRTDIDQTTSAIQPTEVGFYVDALRENAVYQKVGANVMTGLSADYKIPRVGAQTLAWATAENSAAADGGANFTSVTLNPIRLTGYVDISNRVLLQNGQNAIQAVMRDLGRESANKIDTAIFSRAAVSNAPTALAALTGVGTFTEATYSANVSILSDIVEAEQTLAEASGLQGKCAYVASPKLLSDLKKSAQVSSVTPAMEGGAYGMGMINGYPIIFSNACTDSTGAADFLFGDYSQLHVGFFGAGLNITVDPYSVLLNDEVRLVVHNNLDFAPGQRACFVKATSLTA